MSRLDLRLAAVMVGAVLMVPASGVYAQCPGEGSCCEANGTPGCDVEWCCEAVCRFDPLCCDDEWDQICVAIAAEIVCLDGGVCTCPEDANGDGNVDALDLNEVLINWGQTDTPPCVSPYDVNSDCVVDVQDLVFVITHWGPCG